MRSQIYRHLLKSTLRRATHIGFLVLWGGLLTAHAAVAQTTWVTSFSGDIERFDQATGDVRSFGAFDFQAYALVGDNQERLFVVDVRVVDDLRNEGFERLLTLYVVDVRQRTAREIGLLEGVSDIRDLAVDGDGWLWAIDGDGALLSIDPDTASFQVVGGTELQSVAFRQNEMWGIQRQAFDWYLVTLDAENGGTTQVGLLEGFELPPDKTALDFDADGNAWIRWWLVPGIPIAPAVQYYHLQGAATESLELVHDLGNAGRHGFAVDRTPAPIDIPVLGHAGRLALVLLLAAAAGRVIRISRAEE